MYGLTSEENTKTDAMLWKTLQQDIMKGNMDNDISEVGFTSRDEVSQCFGSTLKPPPKNCKSTRHSTNEMIPLHGSGEDDSLDDTNVDDKHEESDNTNSDHNVDDGFSSSSSVSDDDSSDSLSDKQETKKGKRRLQKQHRKYLRKRQKQHHPSPKQKQNPGSHIWHIGVLGEQMICKSKSQVPIRNRDCMILIHL